MKNLYPTLILSLILFCVRCNEDPDLIQKKVTIDFTVSSENELTNELPADSRLLVNIESPDGETVMDYEEVAFEFRENRFYTKPLELAFGSYMITDFLIVNGDDEILYGAPKLSGTLGAAVEHPLDYDFAFSAASRPSRMDLRLMDVRHHQPRDFGYLSFKKPGKRLKIMLALSDNKNPTSGRAVILSGRDTVGHYKLEAKMNQIPLPSAISETYKLAIVKNGYAPVYFVLSDLVLSQGNKPLKVIMTPAFTMKAFIDPATSLTFDFYLSGPEGTSLAIDWGEGAVETVELQAGETNITHTYPSGGNYPIAITGEVDKITSFYSFYGLAMIDAINFHHLANLTQIRFGLTRSPAVLDLSHNAKLQSLMLSGLLNTEKIYLPRRHSISFVSMEGPNRMSAVALDAVINNLYKNTVDQNILNGSIGIPANWYQEEGDETLLGPPSAEVLAKLQLMKENYGWTIFPDPFD